jgi:hypothetical protein
MFKLMVLSLVLSFACPGVYAEEKVGVPLTAGELAFSLNMVNSIELSGGEVGPFLDIKSLLTSAYKDASGGKKGSADVEFTVPMAKNFLFFMQRAKLKGDDAAVFFDLSKKIVAAIKKVTKE